MEDVFHFHDQKVHSYLLVKTDNQYAIYQKRTQFEFKLVMGCLVLDINLDKTTLNT